MRRQKQCNTNKGYHQVETWLSLEDSFRANHNILAFCLHTDFHFGFFFPILSCGKGWLDFFGSDGFGVIEHC